MLPLADPQAYVARHRQLVALAEALDTRFRLVTLHGPHGVGKSRLAAEHLWATAGERRGIVIELEDVTNFRDGLALAASALQAPAAAGPDPVLVLADSLRELGPVTVVFDHVDGVAEALKDPLARWLALCPEAHFVLTASAPLGIPNEHATRVVALSPVRDGRAPSEAQRLWHALRGSEPRRDDELERLLAVLGGLPLAIELVSALAERLTPSALLERMGPKLRDLGESPAEGVVLEVVLSALWSGMNEAERQAFTCCAVFGGSFRRDGFAKVHGDDGPRAEALLDRLIQKRLVARVYTSDGSARFGMHHAVRMEARRRLEGRDPGGVTARRHARHYTERGAALADALEGPTGPAATRDLLHEHENLTRIADRAADGGDGEGVTLRLRALCIRDHVLASFGPVDADLSRLDAALAAAAEAQVDPQVMTEALCVRAFVRSRTGASEPAFEDLAQAERLAETEPLRDGYAAGRVAVTHAFVCMSAGRLEAAELHGKRAVDIAERIDHVRLSGIALGVYALVRRMRGHESEARALYERALAQHRRVENRRFEGIVMTRLSQLRAEAGEADEALDLAERALSLHQTFGDRLMEGLCLEVKGFISHARGELEDARRVLEAARPLVRAAGSFGQATGALALLSRTRMELGDFEHARQLFTRARRGLMERGARRDAALCVSRRAALEALCGELAAAEASFASIEAEASDPISAALGGLDRAQLALAVLRTAHAQGDVASARRALGEAQKSRESLAKLLDSASLSFRDAADARAALRFFDAIMRAHAPHTPSMLRVSLSAHDVVTPRGARFDMRERPALRRILTRLCMQSLRAPGVPARALSLFAAGWPGENPGDENARVQVYAVLAHLRKLGLGNDLISNDRGHMLAPTLAVRFV